MLIHFPIVSGFALSSSNWNDSARSGLSALGMTEVSPGSTARYRDIITVDARSKPELELKGLGGDVREGFWFQGAPGVRAYDWQGRLVLTSCPQWPWEKQRAHAELAKGLRTGEIKWKSRLDELPSAVRLEIEGVLADFHGPVPLPAKGLTVQLRPEANLSVNIKGERKTWEAGPPSDNGLIPLDRGAKVQPGTGQAVLSPNTNSFASLHLAFKYLGPGTPPAQAAYAAEFTELARKEINESWQDARLARSSLFSMIAAGGHPDLKPISEVAKGVPLGETRGSEDLYQLLHGRSADRPSREDFASAVPEGLRWQMFVTIRVRYPDGSTGTSSIQIF